LTSPPEQTPIILRRRTVFVLIFFVTGALTIPLIWKSPVFSRGEKIFWSAFATFYTALMIAVIVVYAIYVYQVTVGRLGGMDF
jgi:hypothetical protein